MKAGIAMLAHSLRRTRILVASVAVLLAAFQILFVIAAESLMDSDSFNRLAALIPDFIRQTFGSSLITVLSFQGVACLGYFHVVVVAVLTGLAIAIGTEPAGEVETRFLDLVLAHPVARHWVITRTVVLLAVWIGLVAASMVLGSWVGLRWLAGGEIAMTAFRLVPQLAFNLAALALCWGGIALVFAARAPRRAVAGAATGVLAMVCYLTDVISQVWQPLAHAARYSPFHYYNAVKLIAGSGDEPGNVLVLLGVALSAFAISYVVFSRRDL